MIKITRSAIATLLVVLLPASLLAVNPAAMAYTRGAVLLNGVPAPESSAVFSGDRVTTGKSSAANLVLNGSSVVVDPESTVLYEGNSFVLQGGGASVMTSKSMAARHGHVSVVPAAAVETDYRVVQVQNNLVVTAELGAVKVVDKEGETLVPQGKVMTVAFADDDNPKPRSAPPTPQGSSKGGAAVLIAVAAGAGAGVIVYLTTRSSSCVSPDGSNPCH
ncbi:MAG: hypothetical protein ACHP78_17805 [Terriglobales bacterium]